MTVHVGQVTSEVRMSDTPRETTEAAAKSAASVWDERYRVAALLERVSADRRRTATGFGDD